MYVCSVGTDGRQGTQDAVVVESWWDGGVFGGDVGDERVGWVAARCGGGGGGGCICMACVLSEKRHVLIITYASLPMQYHHYHHIHSGAQWLATSTTLVAIVTYIAFFALGVGPIPWLYIGEVLPDNIKVGRVHCRECIVGSVL